MPRRGKRRARIWDPMGYPRMLLHRAIEDQVSGLNLPAGARVLDFGCGEQPYRAVFGSEIEYLAADLPGTEHIDLEIREGVIDLPDGSIDLVVSTQVLEHVPDPGAYLRECRRLLSPRGRLLLTTHGVMFYHPHPTDFWRWTADGLRSVTSQAGLSQTSITPLMGAVPMGLWLVMLNLQVKLPPVLRHVVVSLFNVVIRWTNQADWDKFRADFDYVVLAERAVADHETVR